MEADLDADRVEPGRATAGAAPEAPVSQFARPRPVARARLLREVKGPGFPPAGGVRRQGRGHPTRRRTRR